MKYIIPFFLFYLEFLTPVPTAIESLNENEKIYFEKQINQLQEFHIFLNANNNWDTTFYRIDYFNNQGQIQKREFVSSSKSQNKLIEYYYNEYDQMSKIKHKNFSHNTVEQNFYYDRRNKLKEIISIDSTNQILITEEYKNEKLLKISTTKYPTITEYKYKKDDLVEILHSSSLYNGNKYEKLQILKFKIKHDKDKLKISRNISSNNKYQLPQSQNDDPYIIEEFELNKEDKVVKYTKQSETQFDSTYSKVVIFEYTNSAKIKEIRNIEIAHNKKSMNKENYFYNSIGLIDSIQYYNNGKYVGKTEYLYIKD